MNKSARSWSGRTPGSKTAAEHDLRYGSGLLARESQHWPSYFAVTSRSALEAAKPHLSHEPEAVEYASWLDWTHLQEIADKAPAGVELVVGLGGGVALDASKYVALKKGLPLVIVPTIVSTGSIVHSIFAKWDGYATVGNGADWPWINFDHAIIDYDVVLKAPYHLNIAGLGDVLCGYSAIAEWRRNTRLGIGEPFDEALAVKAIALQERIVTGFPKTLDSKGQLTPDSVHFILTAVQQRDDSLVVHPNAPAADHTLWLAAEEINRKTWVHGEFVALGALVIAWYCDERPDLLAEWLDTCRVRRHPSEIGLAKNELRKALDYCPVYMADAANGRDIQSILRHQPMSDSQFDALWAYLETA